MIFDLQGTDNQRRLAQSFLDRGNYPWDVLLPGLQAQTGRSTIPVEWADLSRYAAFISEEGHSHGDLGHNHAKSGFGEDFDLLEYRHRVLGLAWYSGKISLEITLENEPELAGEVLWAEGAHMVDFFFLDEDRREKIFNLFHTGDPDVAPEPHGHGWFDVGTYREFVGEALMGAFTRAFSNFPDTIPFAHTLPDDKLLILRELMLPKAESPPSDEAVFPYFGVAGSSVYHDEHAGIRRDVEWGQRPVTRRPCKVCKP